MGKARDGGSITVKRIPVCAFRCIAAAFGFDIISGGSRVEVHVVCHYFHLFPSLTVYLCANYCLGHV